MAALGVGGGQPTNANARFSKLSSADLSGSDPSGFTNGCELFLDLLVAGIAAPDVSFAGSWMSWYDFAENHSSMAENESSDIGVSGRDFSNRSGGSASVSNLISGAGAASDIFSAGELRFGSTSAGEKLLLEGKNLWLQFAAVTIQRPSPVFANTSVDSQEGFLYVC